MGARHGAASLDLPRVAPGRARGARPRLPGLRGDVPPFDIAQPIWAETREARCNFEVIERADGHYTRDRRDGSLKRLADNLALMHDTVDWPRTVFTPADAAARVEIKRAEELLASGVYDYLAAYVRAYGAERFVTWTVVGGFFVTSYYVGLAGHFLLHDEPALMHCLIDRLTQKTLEEIRAAALAGCDAICIDESTATSDAISPAMYGEFCAPYVRRLVEGIHAHGKKAIVMYWGGVADRIEQIVSLGADALIMETSMKGYKNDLAAIAAQVDGRMLLFGNLDPVGVLQDGTDAELEATLAAQIEVGRRYGRFVVSTGSPVTPETTPERIRKYIELAQRLGA
ncbi:MAG: uroporphyrinogen decarboxylase family protein [Patescibacteria group bacterium]